MRDFILILICDLQRDLQFSFLNLHKSDNCRKGAGLRDNRIEPAGVPNVARLKTKVMEGNPGKY